MKFTVSLVRQVEQRGVIDVEATSAEDAAEQALQLARMDGVLVKRPTWDEPESLRVDVLSIAAERLV